MTIGTLPGATSGVGSLNKSMGQAASGKAGGASGNFTDLVKGVGKEALETSKAADNASVAAVDGTISDLELVQVMTEAEISLQRFKTVYETTKQSLDKILNMGI